MKCLYTFLLALTFLICLPLVSLAQGGGSGGGSGFISTLAPGDAASECYSTTNGLGNNPWPMPLVVRVLREAKDAFGLSQGQMIQAYHECRGVITYLGENRFRVQDGGISVIVVIETF